MAAEVISRPVTVLFLLQAFAIVLFNGIVWFLFLHCRRLRQTSNYFLMSLSAAHISIGFLAVPLYVMTQLSEQLCIVSTSIFYYVLSTCILNMYLVTYERYLAILRPLEYNTRMRKRDVLILISMAWIFPLFLTIVDILFRTVRTIRPFTAGYVVYHWFQSIVFLVIAVILTAANFVMFRAAKRQQRSIQATQNIVSAWPSVGRGRRTTKAAIFFLYIVGTFFIFWTPRIVCDIYELIHSMSLEHSLSDHVTLVIALLNSVLDPVIYLFFNSDFKSSIRSLRARRRNRIEVLHPRPSIARGGHSQVHEMSTSTTTGSG